MPPIALVPVNVLFIRASNLRQEIQGYPEIFGVGTYQTCLFYSEQELSFCIPAYYQMFSTILYAITIYP